MYHSAKIATCCYCGTRAALTLKGRERHELACSSCGAPLHEMKMLKTETPKVVRKARQRYPSDRPKQSRDSRRRKKPKKSMKRRIFEELWDFAEDIFD